MTTDLFGLTRSTCPIGQVDEFASPLRWVLVAALIQSRVHFSPSVWTGSPDNPSVTSAVGAIAQVIAAASASGASGRASCKRQARGPNLDQTAGFLRDDPAGVAALWDTVGQLAGEPRPLESFPYGSPDLRRLRAGRYRVFYTIDEEQRVVQIDHVARLP